MSASEWRDIRALHYHAVLRKHGETGDRFKDRFHFLESYTRMAAKSQFPSRFDYSMTGECQKVGFYV